MARDAELDRLKTAQENAFRRKQETYRIQQDLWERLLDLKGELNRAHEEKQRTYKAQNDSWEHCQWLRSCNGPRIESLNAMQERAFQNMKSAFDSASSAHDRRDGASAKSYAEEGHRYKAEAQGYVSERRRLVEELKSAQAAHNDTKPAFNFAKEKFAEIKRKHDQLKAEHTKAQEEFKRAKSEFDHAAKEFKNRLEIVKKDNSNRRETNRKLAEKAGVPYQYLDEVKVRHEPNGVTDFYFGGIGEEDGLWHGHIVTDPSGNVTYRRLPMEGHGSKNYALSDGIYYGKYDGMRAKIVVSDSKNSNRMDIYYGGLNTPDGIGHNHIAVVGDNIIHMRENNRILIDNK